MKKLSIAVIMAALLYTGSALAHGHIGEQAHSTIIDNTGKKIGQARYIQGNEGVVIEIEVTNLPAGKHGLHFHTVGSCEDHQSFKKAKGHIMPSEKPHGYLNPEGPHEGNLPNIIVQKDGTTQVELYSDLVSISGHDNKPALLDEDGSALIIHEKEDDHKTQPIGGAGARIACGVIETLDIKENRND